ncbi:hypothetical protein KP509_15G063900 [Ceratopteris richardii]|uniref:Xylanase inhibitor C-terminal domain-containing protein n=1 Tax=Ceratopteris richardii TaxID=49495 RepID=A0A8T2T937_CERRI|nr:hypothetical protein KP509_15G063900 [Ceratopteris richardii]
MTAFLFFLLSSLLISQMTCTQPAPAPTALVAPIQLDAATSLYTMKLVPPSRSGNSPLMLDLDNSNVWRDCVDPRPYSSPTFKPLLCNDTAACASGVVQPSPICQRCGSTISYLSLYYTLAPKAMVEDYFLILPLRVSFKGVSSFTRFYVSISVAGVILPINGSMLKIHRDKASRSYVGGTRLSSSVLYTLPAPSIYSVLISELQKAAVAQGMKLVDPVSPFGLCFDASRVKSTRLGHNVPLIEIALKGEGKSKTETWQIYGANSILRLSDQVYCLAFQTTDQYESRSIGIGICQEKDVLVEFDLQADRLGFISSLLVLRTSSHNTHMLIFNFSCTHKLVYKL